MFQAVGTGVVSGTKAVGSGMVSGAQAVGTGVVQGTKAVGKAGEAVGKLTRCYSVVTMMDEIVRSGP